MIGYGIWGSEKTDGKEAEIDVQIFQTTFKEAL